MMKRLQQKCVIASAGMHVLLAVILFIGPGFLSSSSKVQEMPTLDFLPTKLIDAAFSGGGNPKATPPPPAPPAPQREATPPPPAPPVAKVEPKPQPKAPVKEIDPPKDREEVKVSKIDPTSLELSKDTKPKINLTPFVRNADRKKAAEERAVQERAAREEEQNRAREAAYAQRRRAADLIARTDSRIRSSESSSTTIDTNYGPGGGGEAYANYGQFVQSIYEHAWVTPEDAASDSAITKVTVTIANSGRVIKSSIIKRCGDASVDTSVQRTLDRVNFIAPFPDGAKEKERTYIINFNLKTKRLMG